MLCLTAKRTNSVTECIPSLRRILERVRFRGLDTDAEPDGYFFAALTLCQ